MDYETISAQYPIVRDDNGCWVWQGRMQSKGYGWAMYMGKQLLAHRLMYFLRHRELPTCLVLDHICRCRACCNPDHLRAISNKANILIGDGVTAQNARKTVCKSGHALDAQNTLVRKDGRRRCRECANFQRQKWLDKQP